MNGTPRVLATCIHNSDRLEVKSAGIEPGTINPIVVELLKEDGIDIGGKQTRSVFDLHEAGKRFDYVIAVCDKEATGTREEKLSSVRPIRDEIKKKAGEFVQRVSGTHQA